MNETQWSGWRPRQPSARLKRRIFRALGAPAAAWNWHRLTPAMACLLFAMLMVHFNNNSELPSRKPGMTVILSSENSGTGFGDGAQSAQNRLATVTFDWTNHSVFRSSIGSQSGCGPSTNLSN